jgi:hypothetical protein
MHMDAAPANDTAVLLLSTSFLAALIVGGIVGKLAGMMAGVGAGMVAVAAMSLAAAWIAWQGGDGPHPGYVRVEGIVEPDPEGPGRTRNETLTNHDFQIRFAHGSGNTHSLSAAFVNKPVAVGDRIMIDYPSADPRQARVADLETHRTLLMVFVLFGTIPLAMAAAVLAAAWEGRRGVTEVRPQRPAGAQMLGTGIRVVGNLVLIAGFAILIFNDGLQSIAMGFPVIGAGAGIHAAAAIVAGLRLSAAFTYLTVGVGFIGFGLFAQSVSAASIAG